MSRRTGLAPRGQPFRTGHQGPPTLVLSLLLFCVCRLLPHQAGPPCCPRGAAPGAAILAPGSRPVLGPGAWGADGPEVPGMSRASGEVQGYLPPHPRRSQNSPSRTPAVGQQSRVAAARPHLSPPPQGLVRMPRRSGAWERVHRTPVPPGHAPRAPPDAQFPGSRQLTRAEGDCHLGGASRGGRPALSAWPHHHPHKSQCSAPLDGQGDGDSESLGNLPARGQAALPRVPPLGTPPALSRPPWGAQMHTGWTTDPRHASRREAKGSPASTGC